MAHIVLTEAEQSIIVAALRFWQVGDPEDWLHDISCRNGKIAPLDNQDISELAERILPEGPR